MTAVKISVSLEDALLAQCRKLADEEGIALSAFLAEAARERVGLLIARRHIDEHFRLHGRPSEEHLAWARALGEESREE